MFFLASAAMLVAWYGHEGAANPFADVRLIRVSGGEGGYSVACIAAPFKKEPSVVGELTVISGALGEMPPFDSTGVVAWKEVYPFAGRARAFLLTYDKSTALVCDSSIYAPRQGAGNTPSPFYEKLDLLVIPPSTEENILETRASLRPRLIVVAAPCAMPSAQNILCGSVDESGSFCYNFKVRNRKLRLDNNN
jgi:hypothetical protein